MQPRHSSTTAVTERLVRKPIPARRSRPSVRGSKGIKVEHVITIHRPAEELFAFWRNFENLPRVMDHIESVECFDQHRSHWCVRSPRGRALEWDAEIINEHPNELIAWRSLEESDVRHAGSIRFTPLPGGGGTEVKLAIEYEAGKFTNVLAKLFRHSPEQQILEDLRRFKQIMEAGDIRIEGQGAVRTKVSRDLKKAK